MANLVTTAYAKEHIAQTTYTAAETTLVDDLVSGVSKAVKMFCNREFDSQTFDELYNGQDQTILQLRQYPIISLDRIRTNPTDVLSAKNTSSANQRATVHTTTTTCVVVHVATAVTVTGTITYADADSNTLTELATKITNQGAGWTGTLLNSDWADFATVDIAAMGRKNAKNVLAYLFFHFDDFSDYRVDYERGQLVSKNGLFVNQDAYYRIKYTAGFATVPADVQVACGKWVANLYWAAKTSPKAITLPMGGNPPQIVTQLLACWRKHSF